MINYICDRCFDSTTTVATISGSFVLHLLIRLAGGEPRIKVDELHLCQSCTLEVADGITDNWPQAWPKK